MKLRRKTQGHTKKTKREKGVVLLIAVIISSLVLALGIGIGNIIVKEIVLTSLSRNSRVAFFAADAGVECAMHWDLIRNISIERQGGIGSSPDVSVYPTSVFATNTPSVNNILAGNFYGDQSMSENKFNPFCAGQPAADLFDNTLLQNNFDREAASDANAPTYITRFFFYPTLSGAEYDSLKTTPNELNKNPCVLVRIEKTETSGPPVSFITSIFAEGFSSCNPDDLRRVSRGLRVDYSI